MGKHFLIWLMIIIFTPLALPALLSPKTMSLTIRKDYNAAISIFGEKDEINKELITLYKSNLTSTAAFANEFRDRHDDSKKLRNSGDNIGEAIADIPGDCGISEISGLQHGLTQGHFVEMGHLVADTDGDGTHCRDFRAEIEIRYLQSANTADLQHIDSHAVGVELHAALMADFSNSHTFINHTDDCSIDQCFYQLGNCELSKLLKLHKQKN